MCWHESLRTVPKGFSLFLAHEFFDALPVHKFVRTAEGWREILIDIDPDSKVGQSFHQGRFVKLDGLRSVRRHYVSLEPISACSHL